MKFPEDCIPTFYHVIYFCASEPITKQKQRLTSLLQTTLENTVRKGETALLPCQLLLCQ